jgi:hypothetical protein
VSVTSIRCARKKQVVCGAGPVRPLLLLLVLVGACVGKTDASDDQEPGVESTLAPEKDSRLAKLANARPQKIGVLTYYPNDGGGYTFTEEGTIVFCALPYVPTTRQAENMVLPMIGPTKMPLGEQTIYRSRMTGNGFGVLHRADFPIAKWSRDTPDGKFRLTIKAEDNETRLKLKSIIPVLERAEHKR